MNIHIGNQLGYYFDYLQGLPDRIIYKVKNNVILPTNSEMFEKVYELYPEFLPSKDKLLVDVGAQYADYSILANKKYGARVVAFEPLSENYNKAMELITKNKADINLYQTALSDDTYIETIHYNGDMLFVDKNGIKSQQIKFITLDSLYLEPDILKIDVEGYEMHVLRGAIDTIREYHPRIIIETHSAQLEGQVRNFLKRNHYSEPKEGRRSNGNNWMNTVVNLFFMPEK